MEIRGRGRGGMERETGRSDLLTNFTGHEVKEHALGSRILRHGHLPLEETLSLEVVLEHRHRTHMESEVEVSECGSSLLLVVLLPALFVRENLERLRDLLQLGLSFCLSVLVRVVPECERPIRLLDLLWRGCLRESEHLVVVLLALRRYHS
ncbi:hypothetical protein PMAYCL1PPCAC_06123, partial [Pristionchus mayeri]